MLRDEADPYSAQVFLESWAAEIRAGLRPPDGLDVGERLNEYLDPDVPPAVEAALVAEVTRATEQLLREAREAEATWTTATMNDRLAAAFEDLDRGSVLTSGYRGLTVHDGWGYVGLHAQPRHTGAVFYHQQDVYDALCGLSLPLAFGGVGDAPEDPSVAHATALAVLDALAKHGVPAAWTGRVEDRIEVLPFEWRRRRFTPSPCAVPAPAVPWRRDEYQPPLFQVPKSAIEPYHVPVRAYTSTLGLDVRLSVLLRGAWVLVGGARGQVGHAGPPHVFVRAGEMTTVAPRDALANLDPVEAAALRAQGRAGRPTPAPPAAKRPWWKPW